MNLKKRKAGCLFSLIKLLVLTFVILAVIIYFSISFIATGAVKYGGKMIGLDMGLGSFSLALTEQSVELENFYIKNPEGFNTSINAIALTKARVDLGLGVSEFLLQDLIVIDEIIIEGVELNMQYSGAAGVFTGDSNINAIISKVQSQKDKEVADAQAINAEQVTQSPAEAQKEYKLIIKKVVFKNGKIAGGVTGATATMPLPDFEILDIGVKEGGVSPTSAGLTVLSSVSYHAVAALANGTVNVINNAGKATGSAISDGFNVIKGLFNNN